MPQIIRVRSLTKAAESRDTESTVSYHSLSEFPKFPEAAKPRLCAGSHEFQRESASFDGDIGEHCRLKQQATESERERERRRFSKAAPSRALAWSGTASTTWRRLATSIEQKQRAFDSYS